MLRDSVIPGALREALWDCRHLCVLTGSGISAASGVPTFRDAQTGLWKDFDPIQMATPEAFARDPELVWRWYRWRRELVVNATPNSAHSALVTLASQVPKLCLVTQNVDGLHQRAGSEDVIEFHGNLFADICSDDRNHRVQNSQADLPICDTCGALVRPGVVWFGESISPSALESAEFAASHCDMFFAIGTSSQVWPAAGLCDIAANVGAITVEINPDSTALSEQYQYIIGATAEVALAELLN